MRVTMRLAGIVDTSRSGAALVMGGSEAVPWRWQADFWDTQMRDGDQYHRKWLYVRENPVRAGLVADADAWPFQGEVHSLWW